METDWFAIILSGVIAVVIAVTFRYVIKHELNQIYGTNRTDLINDMLNDVYRVQNIMADVFSIIERQSGFNPKEDMDMGFTERDRSLLRWNYRQIHTYYDGFKGFNQWRSHMTKKEFFALANYISMSDGFVETLLNDLTYLRSFLEERKKHALEIIDLFGSNVSTEFRDAWKDTS